MFKKMIILCASLLIPFILFAKPILVELNQTGCQFLEPEKTDHKYAPKKSLDCKEINRKTSDQRMETVKPLKLKAGKYVFRVKNKNVPYPLGFWFRGTGLKRIFLPSVSGGGIKTGATKDYEIDLKPGTYIYSCPLNPTPNYPVIVEE